jgi:hypothetical protein
MIEWIILPFYLTMIFMMYAIYKAWGNDDG